MQAGLTYVYLAKAQTSLSVHKTLPGCLRPLNTPYSKTQRRARNEDTTWIYGKISHRLKLNRVQDLNAYAKSHTKSRLCPCYSPRRRRLSTPTITKITPPTLNRTSLKSGSAQFDEILQTPEPEEPPMPIELTGPQYVKTLAGASAPFPYFDPLEISSKVRYLPADV